MTPRELRAGQPYYQITYADPDLTVPGVTPLIFIGVNVLDQKSSQPDTEYTFQDTVSFRRFGSVAEYRGAANLAEEGLTVYTFNEKDLQDLTDLAGAIQALTEAQARAQSLPR
jgi:hypothetical protein